MKALIMSKNQVDVKRVFSDEILIKIKNKYTLFDEVICKSNIDKFKDVARETDVIFATWGMETFNKEEIKSFFPNLKYIYYCAGTVQHFARPFIESGVRVFSAWTANAVPVAEFTFAQIILSNKGYFQASKKCKIARWQAHSHSQKSGGNYRTTIGIIGVGMIGGLVCDMLKVINCDILAYDPYLDDAKAKKLNVKKVELAELFAKSDTISNHLADKDELNGVLNYNLFKLMKPYATFINTGRGRQVVEKDLIKALRESKHRTALLDVTYPEPPPFWSGMFRHKNIILTPHIAGSLGREVWRMAEYMILESDRIDNGESPISEVTLKMLETMA